jgi:hypothetical protein
LLVAARVPKDWLLNKGRTTVAFVVALPEHVVSSRIGFDVMSLLLLSVSKGLLSEYNTALVTLIMILVADDSRLCLVLPPLLLVSPLLRLTAKEPVDDSDDIVVGAVVVAVVTLMAMLLERILTLTASLTARRARPST